MRKICFFISALVFCLAVSSCTSSARQPEPADPPVSERTVFAMDTVMTFKVYGDGGDAVIDECESLVREVEELISKTREGSDVFLLNSAENNAVKVSADTAALLRKSLEFSEKTGGAFDITVAPLVSLWNIGGGRTEPPEQDEITPLLDTVGYSMIDVDGDLVSMNGAKIDLGAIGKGYVSDRLAQLLNSSANVSGALFSLGGNVGVVGIKPEDKPFVIGIRNPAGQADEFLGYLELTDTFVVSSGDYERNFEYDGVLYHHIIDPETGWPSRSDLKEVSVICGDGTYADALSTALFVMGSDKAMDYYREQSGFEAVMVTQDHRVYVTDGIKDSFIFTGAEAGFIYE